jgi:hypothetical protein
LRPPGGLVLAQLQLGNLHFDASHEYPAASGLVVGPVKPPSCAATRRGRRVRRAAWRNMAERKGLRMCLRKGVCALVGREVQNEGGSGG